MIHADPILPLLWQGGRPSPGPEVRDDGFDMLVLCEDEFQPDAKAFPGVEVVHAPNDDDPSRLPTPHELGIAKAAAKQVTEALRKRKRVLVVCRAGLNRSGLVVALTLHYHLGMSGKDAVAMVRARRRSGSGIGPLSNPGFVDLLESL